MAAIKLWLRRWIDKIFYGGMSPADLAQMAQEDRQKSFRKMVFAGGNIKGAVKKLHHMLEGFSLEVSRANALLDRENSALDRAQKRLEADPTNQRLQLEVQVRDRAVQMAGNQVRQWNSAIKDLNGQVQALEVRDQTAQYAIYFREFQDRFKLASDTITLAKADVRDVLHEVAESYMTLIGAGEVSTAEAFLERKRREIDDDTYNIEGRIEVAEDLLRNRVLSTASADEIDPEVAEVIKKSRERLHLPVSAPVTADSSQSARAS